MSRVIVAPIVEGHGDSQAVPVLLRRIANELYAFYALEVLRPIRMPRTKATNEVELRRAVELARLKGAEAAALDDTTFVLMLLDADDDPPCMLAPRLLRSAHRDDVDVSVVLANVEFETWFVGAASSLEDFLDLSAGGPPPQPEIQRCKKAWIEHRFKGNYGESIDQEKLAARMDLAICRATCPSFDKLCRELALRISPA
jgi:hypothetical protein